MNALEQDIVDLYENQDMSVNDIVHELNDTDITDVAVKMVLSVHSHKFQLETVEEAKRLNGKNTKTISANSTEQQMRNPNLVNSVDKKQIFQTLLTLMNQSDNDMVRVRAAIYLNEEVSGRNEKRVKMHNVPDVAMNVRALNDQIVKARELISAKLDTIGNSPMLASPPSESTKEWGNKGMGSSCDRVTIVDAEVVNT